MQRFSWPTPGTTISTPLWGPFRHMGIVSEQYFNGKPMVWANAPDTKGVRLVPMDFFTKGKSWKVEPRNPAFPPFAILQRAQNLSARGFAYDVATYNCEHFVSVCNGEAPQSRQLDFVLLATSVLLLGVASYRAIAL